MKRILITLGLAAALVGPPPVWAHVDVNVDIGVPPPPVISFPSPPQVVVVPRTRVYYAPAVSDYDLYRYGPYWYVDRDGYWYRSRAYGGPYAPIEYRYVPRQVVVVPGKYRHHPVHPHGKPYKHQKHYRD